MNWIDLASQGDLKELIEKSYDKPQVIYKHSTRCGRCTRVKHQLEDAATPENIDFHYLDLWKHRDLSNQIAADFNIRHESPQVILLVNGRPAFHANHWKISMQDLQEEATKNSRIKE